DLGARRRVGADRAGELADTQAGERVLDAVSVACDLERPARELEAERRRFRVDPVGAPDRERLCVLLRPPDDDRERGVDSVEKETARLLYRERQRGVDDVRRREAEVEPAPVGSKGLGNGVDEGREVVVRLALKLSDASRVGNPRSRSDLARRLTGNRSDLCPGIDRRELDSKPAFERRLLRPDARHRRPGVAWNHWSDSNRRVRRATCGVSKSRPRTSVPSTRSRSTLVRDSPIGSNAGGGKGWPRGRNAEPPARPP